MYLCKESADILNAAHTVVTGPSASFHIHYWGMNARLFDNPVHKHSFFEICYVLEGEGVYTDDGVDHILKAGTHFVSRPGITHQIRTQKGLYIVFVAFDLDESSADEWVREAYRTIAEDANVVVYDGDAYATAHLWKTLMLRHEECGNVPQAGMSQVAYALLLSFLALFGKSVPLQQTGRPKNTNLLLQQAKMYIRDNLSQPLNLPGVARYLNVSERHLSRLFATGIHESFTQYLNGERIRQASHLLLTTDLPIKEIAESSGFSSVHYFSRLFKAQKQVPPASFREGVR
ncbi:hypothetical protein SY83_21035 [Paenibacillus swuensis]|uniref:HTH araC/xylS-type domain-containing protein n=1 Tax=Paenibacillus swuensis TaxID=1178515 RepID=A0A172TNN0_9BACL|nr:AraC family transcriptional regulator [Paenibacillus swuensis]ANE48353.1 hypothetical protein SY83_21035 [Paenibacillus swuensis]